jgi:hypothetical protein
MEKCENEVCNCVELNLLCDLLCKLLNDFKCPGHIKIKVLLDLLVSQCCASEEPDATYKAISEWFEFTYLQERGAE